MYKENLEKLFYQRFLLHSRKFELLRRLKPRRYGSSVRLLTRVHIIINKEILTNNKICRLLQRKKFEREFVGPVCLNLKEINKVLLEENKLLYHTNFLTYIGSYFETLFTKRKGYFQRKVGQFRRLNEREKELSRIFFELSRKLPRDYRIDEKEVKGAWKLVVELQEELRNFGSVVGQTELVRKQAKRILFLVSQIQKTEIYGFIGQDVNFVKEKAEYVMKHPKENKLVYFLTAVYIVAPLTFEMTGAILFVKYLGKYTISKAKKLRV
jgi:hypothetical protein